MGPPRFDAESLPFDASGLATKAVGAARLFAMPMPIPSPQPSTPFFEGFSQLVPDFVDSDATFFVAIASMGNPHVVTRIGNINHTSIGPAGLWLREHPRFAQGVNAGFMQVVSPTHIKLRVVERGVGETLACGTGACAAVASGIAAGWLRANASVQVDTRGGILSISWAGGAADPVLMTGPATTVFHTTVQVPDHPMDVLNFSL
jgi:diaminopimelate epimerase